MGWQVGGNGLPHQDVLSTSPGLQIFPQILFVDRGLTGLRHCDHLNSKILRDTNRQLAHLYTRQQEPGLTPQVTALVFTCKIEHRRPIGLIIFTCRLTSFRSGRIPSLSALYGKMGGKPEMPMLYAMTAS